VKLLIFPLFVVLWYRSIMIFQFFNESLFMKFSSNEVCCLMHECVAGVACGNIILGFLKRMMDFDEELWIVNINNNIEMVKKLSSEN
jgi:hypothetical protein